MAEHQSMASLVAECSVLRQELISTRRRLSDNRELLAGVRRKQKDSTKLLARASSLHALPSNAAVTRTKVLHGRQANAEGKTRTFAAVTDLIEQVECAAVRDGAFVEDIVLAMQNNKADPSLLMGILLEALAQTVQEKLPMLARRDTAVALCSLLFDRITTSDAPAPRSNFS